MTTKHTLRTDFNGPFASAVPFVELEGERILANNVIFPGQFNPHGVRLWVIGNEYGALGAVWADHEQDALDELIDSGLGEALLIPEDEQASASEEEREEWTGLGNASEPCDLTHVWMASVKLEVPYDMPLLMALAEARGACAENLSDYAPNQAFSGKPSEATL